MKSQEQVTPTTHTPPWHHFDAITVREILEHQKEEEVEEEEKEEESSLSDVLSFHCLLAP